MTFSEGKYQIQEDKQIKEFHRRRRMFAIHKDELFLAEKDTEDSHATWFRKEGWISEEDDSLMDEIVRGYVDEKGDVYFYKGYDFRIDEESEEVLFSKLSELQLEVGINDNSKLFGGMRVQDEGGKWPPINSYGSIADMNKKD